VEKNNAFKPRDRVVNKVGVTRASTTSVHETVDAYDLELLARVDLFSYLLQSPPFKAVPQTLWYLLFDFSVHRGLLCGVWGEKADLGLIIFTLYLDLSGGVLGEHTGIPVRLSGI